MFGYEFLLEGRVKMVIRYFVVRYSLFVRLSSIENLRTVERTTI